VNYRRVTFLVGLTASALVAIVFLAGFVIGRTVERQRADGGVASTSDPNLRDFLTAYNLVTHESYFRMLNHHHLIYAAINGMMAATGDPHTLFLSPPQNISASHELNGSQFSGIGAIVLPAGSTLSIITPVPGSPAARAGLRPDDVITAIDGTPVARFVGSSAVDHIHGRTGTYVALTIVRHHGAPFTVRVQRAQIPAITAYGRQLGNGLAYLAIVSFGQTTGQEVATTLRDLTRRPIRGIIIDLRGNPGGYVDAAQHIVSQFVTHGVVAYEQNNDKQLSALPVVSADQVPHVPIAILVDGQSASASEITAAALRDDAHAVLVGTRTYGKGSMQSVYPLNDGASIRITDRLWLTPTKQSIGHVGLKPDIEVQTTAADVARGIDPQLKAAERYLLERHSR